MSDADPERADTELLFEELIRRVAFNPAAPAWTPELLALHRYSVRRRLQITPEHFTTPAYSAASVPDAVWAGRLDAGITYEADRQLEVVATLMAHADELRELAHAGPPTDAATTRFYWSNTEFSHDDAALYYSLLRTLGPRRVIEVGGGFSTLLASEAARRNGAMAVDCIEPYPRAFIERGLPCVNLIPKPVQDVPVSFFTTLEAGDVLFIDGTHVCKTGSDVNYMLLGVLPYLRGGVWVHVHDVFLPFEYPRQWVSDRFLYWNEQYVLAALLSGSRKFEVVVAIHFLYRVAPQKLARLMPRLPGVAPGGASYWIRSRE